MAAVLTSGMQSAVWFAAYEESKRVLRARRVFGGGWVGAQCARACLVVPLVTRLAPAEQSGVAVSLTSGALASVVGVVLTNPFDVARTRQQVFDMAIPSEAAVLKSVVEGGGGA